MTKLSININKIATLRNARGGNIPDVLKAAIDCQKFGGEGITVHPRPDERHIKYKDVRSIKPLINTEFNIEGYPSNAFMELILEVLPHQVTFVPDPPDVLTSNAGWDTVKNKSFLQEKIGVLKEKGIRTSIFMETDIELIKEAKNTGTDRIELYTENYASNFQNDKEKAIKPYKKAAEVALEHGLGLNAGHDLDLSNVGYFIKTISEIKEVSIGHALIADALYYGLENTIQLYLKEIKS